MRTPAFAIFAGLGLTLSAQAQLDRLLEPVTPQYIPPATVSPAVPAPASKHPAVAAHSLSADELLGDLEKQLAEHFKTDGELKLAFSRTIAAVPLPAADWAVEVVEWPTGGISSTFFLRIKISSEGQPVAETQVPLRAQLFQEVWAAANRLERGQTIDRASLTTQKVDVLRERTALLPASAEPGALEAVLTIPAGRPLAKRDVAAKPVVRKGQTVEAVGQAGLLCVRMKAIALENGAAGDLIKLRNVESRKDFNAQILDENKVQILF